MRLYLSSSHLGARPDELRRLLAGHTRTALIPNAIDNRDGQERTALMGRVIDELVGIGLEPIALDLRDYFGKMSNLRATLADFDLIYVRGGNPFILRRAFRQSGADAVLSDLLTNDAVAYAAYSAGSCLVGPTLRGIERSSHDPKLVPPGYHPQVIWEGLRILPFAILPHYRSGHPNAVEIDGMVPYYIEHHVPFIALRDGEALVVDGERQVVVGQQ